MVWEPKEKYEKLTEGAKVFQIFEVTEPVSTSKGSYRTWKLNTHEGGETKQIWVNMFGSSEILTALGYKEKENELGEIGFEWEVDDVKDKIFKAVLIYRKSKDGTKEFPSISMCEAIDKDDSIPF
jgi:hypothetical protein